MHRRRAARPTGANTWLNFSSPSMTVSGHERLLATAAKIAAAVMAASLCSKVTANPDEYAQNYFDILQKRYPTKDEPAGRRRAAATMERPKGLVFFGSPSEI